VSEPRPRQVALLPLPTARAFGYGLLAAGLALHSLTSALSALGLWLAAIGFDALLARREPPPEATVAAPRRVSQGQRGELLLELWNPSARRQRLAAAVDGDPALLAPSSFAVRRFDLRPRASASWALAFEARLRGPRVLQRLHLRRAGPLGLGLVRESLELDLTVQVVPGLREVNAARARAAYQARRLFGRRRQRQIGAGGSFESLREYVRGDEPRHLDWKATARRGVPMVRRYEAERSQNLVLALDCGRLGAERFDGLERLDHALAGAVVLSRVAEDWRDQVGLFAFADRTARFLPPGSYPTSRLIDSLASLEARPVEPDYPRALLELSQALRRRSLVVLFSDLSEGGVSAPLAEHLALLARRHLPLLIALRNPELHAAAQAPCTDRAGVYRRAAALELSAARRAALEGLRRAGVQVVDIEPQDSIEGAVDAYLRIKQRGLL
jgi:uncharacterized protein (DUF58 family)